MEDLNARLKLSSSLLQWEKPHMFSSGICIQVIFFPLSIWNSNLCCQQALIPWFCPTVFVPFSACSHSFLSSIHLSFGIWDQWGGEKRNWYLLRALCVCHICVSDRSSHLVPDDSTLRGLPHFCGLESWGCWVRGLSRSTELENSGARTQIKVFLTLISFKRYHIALGELEAMQFSNLSLFGQIA